MDYVQLAKELFQCLVNSKKAPANRGVDDISRGEMAVLSYLVVEHNGATASEISERFEIMASRVTAIVNGLLRKGFIEKINDAQDKRKSYIYYTEEGKDFSQSKYEEAINDLEGLLRFLGEEDAKEHVRIMKKVYAYHNERREKRIENKSC